ncbi:uncharacterized protein METZ01_LOCUS502530, partial [marine metagenome]
VLGTDFAEKPCKINECNESGWLKKFENHLFSALA